MKFVSAFMVTVLCGFILSACGSGAGGNSGGSSSGGGGATTAKLQFCSDANCVHPITNINIIYAQTEPVYVQDISGAASGTLNSSFAPIVDGLSVDIGQCASGLNVNAICQLNLSDAAGANAVGSTQYTITPQSGQSITLAINYSGSVTTQGKIGFHFYYGVPGYESPQNFMDLTGDKYTDLIMSNFIAGIMYGHLIQEYTPNIQFNKDYLYGSIFGQFLQENINAEDYMQSSDALDPAPEQQAVFAVGQGGPYQINNYATEMVFGGYSPQGFSLINYVAIQGNIGYSMTDASAQHSKVTPLSFNNKYYGPMLAAYFHYNDYLALQYIGCGDSLELCTYQPWSPTQHSWIPVWQPFYYDAVIHFEQLPNSTLDILLNVAYNQGYYGPLFSSFVQLSATATTETINAMNSYSTAWGTDTYGQYPYQVHNYLDQLYGNPTPLPSDLSKQSDNSANHVAFNMGKLEFVFDNVFDKLSYLTSSTTAEYITSDQANTAFNSALLQAGLNNNSVLDLSNAAQRVQIFTVLENAISILEKNLNTKFTNSTLLQVQPTPNF